MILAIDIGNSNIVASGFDSVGKIAFMARIATEKLKTDDQYAAELRTILRLDNVKESDIEGSIVSSVVPPLSRTLYRAVEKLTGNAPLMVGPGIKTGLNIMIDDPSQLGSDMVANSVAAIHKYGAPFMAIDMGTSTTMFCVDEKGAFRGGALFPGMRISLDAFAENASQLPHISIEAPENVVRTNTVECMQSGIVYGYASMIDGMIERFEKETGKFKTVILTGGLSRHIYEHCKQKVTYDPTLLLDGLYLIYQKNRPA